MYSRTMDTSVRPLRMFLDRLRENIEKMPTGEDNKSYLKQALGNYRVYKHGYDPDTIVTLLESAELIYTGRPETLHQRIRAAVVNAGKFVLDDLTTAITSGGSGAIERAYTSFLGIQDFALHYGADKEQDYLQNADRLWADSVTVFLAQRLRSLQYTAENEFDPRKTSTKVEKQASELSAHLDRYKIDPSRIDSRVDTIVKAMYERSFGILWISTLDGITDESPDGLSDLIEDIEIVLEYGWNAGYDIDSLRKSANRMLSENREWNNNDRISSEFKAGVGSVLMEVDVGYDDNNERLRSRGQELLRESARLAKPYLIEQAVKKALRDVESLQKRAQQDF